jgi:hypothetical protein
MPHSWVCDGPTKSKHAVSSHSFPHKGSRGLGGRTIPPHRWGPIADLITLVQNSSALASRFKIPLHAVASPRLLVAVWHYGSTKHLRV